MSDSICMIIRRAPYGTIQAAEAVRYINGAIAEALPSGYEGLVDLMMEKYNSAIGAF